MTSQSNPSVTTFQSTTTANSTTPFGVSPHPQKDYAAAFGTLQSRYGTSGVVPSPKKDPSKKLPQPAQSSTEPASGTSSHTFVPSSPKFTTSETSSTDDVSNPKKPKGSKSFLKAMFKGSYLLVLATRHDSHSLRSGKAKET
ncbi:unnamed protein product [Cyclocybe aegerita]|uniref:Uncharacterized protein n=1 Tax=Cyclocybe aegerita TaxID=1973307 RepID=A0A8S0XGB8_CYCAE|nr:unnamed protein product [Cyclocybe aegerita]